MFGIVQYLNLPLKHLTSESNKSKPKIQRHAIYSKQDTSFALPTNTM